MSNLKIVNFKDFKSRWGLDSDLDSEYITQYFYFIKDALIEFEDDGLLEKYMMETGSLKANIYKDNIEESINRIYDYLKAKSTISGNINTTLIIKAPIHISKEIDIIDLMESVIERFKFLRDNEFDCKLEILTQHFLITVTKDIISNRKD